MARGILDLGEGAAVWGKRAKGWESGADGMEVDPRMVRWRWEYGGVSGKVGRVRNTGGVRGWGYFGMWCRGSWEVVGVGVRGNRACGGGLGGGPQRGKLSELARAEWAVDNTTLRWKQCTCTLLTSCQEKLN